MKGAFAALLLLTIYCAGAQAQSLPAAMHTEQTSPTSSNSKKEDDADEAFVFEDIATSESYEADGTGEFSSGARVLLQSEAGVQQFGLLTFSYQKEFQNVTIDYVRARKPNGTVIDTPLSEVQDLESEVTREAPFYSDLREKHVAVKGLSVGDVLEWHTTTRIFKALAPGQFWSTFGFTRQAIVRSETYRLSVPRDMYVNVRSRKIQPAVKDEGNRRVYEWQYSQLTRPQEDLKLKYGPPFRQLQPEIEISSFKSWDDVGRWYESLQHDRVLPSAEIKAKAAELTKDAKTDSEKIRALYNFVATHFRYIGVAFGVGRYQPHAAGDVLDNGYGDCKDKHTLLASLLTAVGIEASPALISSVHALDPEVPSPGQFDHVITAVNLGKDVVWLDTTSEIAPFEMLTPNLRDKKALLIPANAPARLVDTPAKPAVAQSEHLQVTGTLSQTGELTATVDETVRGDEEILLRSAFHHLPQPRWKDLVQQIASAQGLDGTISNVVASSPEKTDEAFHISYKCDRTQFSEFVSSKRITLPLPGFNFATLNDEYEKSAQPVQLGSPGDYDYVAEIKMPKGYTPALPDAVDAQTEFAEYHAKYSVSNGVLHVDRHLITKQKEVPSSEYVAYSDFDRKLDDDDGAWVTFSDAVAGTPVSSNLAASGATSAQPPSASDAEAIDLYRKGLLALQSRNFAQGIDDLEHVTRLNPKLPGLWSSLGSAYMMTQNYDAGIDAFRRQTKETPDAVLAYKMLGFGLMQLRRQEEAIPVWHKVMELSPVDRDAPANLGMCLVSLKRFQDAVPDFEEAVKLNPKSANNYFQLGRSYSESGEGEKSFAAYSKAVDLDESYSAMRNDAAFDLGDKGVHLSDAETWAKEAVEDKEDDTRDTDLQQLDSKHLGLMTTLSAYWDTLGWIYFKEGKLDAAEPYLQAAWSLLQDTDIGEHLGELYEKKHRPQKATEFYALAEAAPDHLSKTAVRQHLEHLLQNSTLLQEKRRDAREQLGRMRTIRLPRITNKSATADFFILLTNNGEERLPTVERGKPAVSGKAPEVASEKAAIAAVQNVRKTPHVSVEQVKFIKGDEELRSLDKVLANLNYEAQFPDNVLTKIVRRGVVVCSAATQKCELTLLTADMVRTPE